MISNVFGLQGNPIAFTWQNLTCQLNRGTAANASSVNIARPRDRAIALRVVVSAQKWK